MHRLFLAPPLLSMTGNWFSSTLGLTTRACSATTALKKCMGVRYSKPLSLSFSIMTCMVPYQRPVTRPHTKVPYRGAIPRPLTKVSYQSPYQGPVPGSRTRVSTKVWSISHACLFFSMHCSQKRHELSSPACSRTNCLSCSVAVALGTVGVLDTLC